VLASFHFVEKNIIFIILQIFIIYFDLRDVNMSMMK